MLKHMYCRNNINDELTCGICGEMFNDLTLFIIHRQEEIFFRNRENAANKERRTHEVGGTELTSEPVRALLKRTQHQHDFDEDNECCVCRSDTPPNSDCIDEDDIHWLGCERCSHWVHIGLCVPIQETDFVCPCHLEECDV